LLHFICDLMEMMMMTPVFLSSPRPAADCVGFFARVPVNPNRFYLFLLFLRSHSLFRLFSLYCLHLRLCKSLEFSFSKQKR
jgi:hypothetical protein